MISFRGVQKKYDSKFIIQDASFRLEQGEFVFLSGESGEGKTTILRMIFKEVKPTAGTILLFGKDIRKLKQTEIRRNVGYIFQESYMIEKKTIQENIAFALEVMGRGPWYVKRKTEELMEQFSITDIAKKMPEQVSGGQKQRAALARAMINDPNILLCDEPTNQLDERNAGLVMDKLLELNKEGKTILMVTHDKRIIEKSDRRVLYLQNGILSDSNRKHKVTKQMSEGR